jgi:PAS domain S-box-containing protein
MSFMDQNVSTIEIEEKIAQKEEVIQHLTRRLEDVKNFTESIIQSIGSGIIITEMNDTITYINKAGERILGYGKEELMGRPFGIFSLKEKQSAIPSFLNNPDDMDTRKEGWMKKKDHTEFPVGFTINNHLSIRGEKIGKIVVFRDLTNVYKIDLCHWENLLRALPMNYEIHSPGLRQPPKPLARRCPETIQEENIYIESLKKLIASMTSLKHFFHLLSRKI